MFGKEVVFRCARACEGATGVEPRISARKEECGWVWLFGTARGHSFRSRYSSLRSGSARARNEFAFRPEGSSFASLLKE